MLQPRPQGAFSWLWKKAPGGRGCLCYHKLMTFHMMRPQPFFIVVTLVYFGGGGGGGRGIP